MKSGKIQWKRVAILLGGLLGFCLLCGLIGMLAGKPLLTTLRGMLWETDPEKVTAIGHELLDYQLPAGYREQMGLRLQGTPDVVIIDRDGNPADFYFCLELETLKANSPENQEFRSEIEVAWTRQIGSHEYNTESVGTRELTVRGAPVTFSVREGTDEAGTPVRQLVGVIAGKSGDVVVIITGHIESWNEELLTEFTSGIR